MKTPTNAINTVAKHVYKKIQEQQNMKFSDRLKTSCEYTNKNNMIGSSYCQKCLDMPSEIANIRYALNSDLPKKLNEICQKYNSEQVISKYCTECKHMLILNLGQISMFSSNDFVKSNKDDDCVDCKKNIPNDLKYVKKNTFIKKLKSLCDECDDKELTTKFCYKCKNLVISI
jgi:hypothetical protein